MSYLDRFDGVVMFLGVLGVLIAIYHLLAETDTYVPGLPDPCSVGTPIVQRDALGVKTATYCIAGPAPQDAR